MIPTTKRENIMNHGIHSIQGTLLKKEGDLFNTEDMNGYLYITFYTEEAAEKFISNFPKYCKATLSNCYYLDENKESKSRPSCNISIMNFCDARTGEFNETAQKRQDKTTEILKKLGLFE
jgi:hypothetical protein